MYDDDRIRLFVPQKREFFGGSEFGWVSLFEVAAGRAQKTLWEYYWKDDEAIAPRDSVL